MELATFGRRLKELRESAGLTQDELAVKAGLGTNVVGRLERGAREPGWLTILAMATALGVECTAFNQPPASGPAEPRRGRPRKTSTATEVAADAAPAKPSGEKPKRGRPRKTPADAAPAEPSGGKPAPRKPRKKGGPK